MSSGHRPRPLGLAAIVLISNKSSEQNKLLFGAGANVTVNEPRLTYVGLFQIEIGRCCYRRDVIDNLM